jgi:hypothetical protein
VKTQVKFLTEAIGKTIHKVVLNSEEECVCVLFTDETFSVLEASGGDEEARIRDIGLSDYHFQPEEQIFLGLRSAEEIAALEAEGKARAVALNRKRDIELLANAQKEVERLTTKLGIGNA